MPNYEEILTGTTVPALDENEPIGYDPIEETEINADIVDITDHLGTEDFQFLYLNLYHEIRLLDLERQKRLCEILLDEFTKIYSFEFTPQLFFESINDVENFLKFIEFIEFDYIDFLADIIKGLDLSLLKSNTETFLKQNWFKLDAKINNLIENEKISKLISIFLRTNNKKGILEFLQTRLDRSKMLVILKIMEGEFQNERDFN